MFRLKSLPQELSNRKLRLAMLNSLGTCFFLWAIIFRWDETSRMTLFIRIVLTFLFMVFAVDNIWSYRRERNHPPNT